MKKRTSVPGPPEETRDGARGVDLTALGFGFDAPDDVWLERLRLAEAPQALGSIGPYELLDEVSRGGQGVVFRARQPGTKRQIALKRMLAGSFATSAMHSRFQREVESAASLNHPNIVTAYGMEIVDGLPVFAMEWVDGVPATEWARDGHDPRGVLELFLRICDAIQHAHSRGVLHRDLKPSNILVDDAGQPHVLDFGLAKRMQPELGADDEGKSNGVADDVTRTDDFVGTPAYASPEQFKKSANLDERTDVYSLGVLLFEMLTGISPYGDGKSVTELILAVERGEAARPSSIDPRLGREVDTIVLEAMATERDDRYRSVDAFARDIRHYLAGEPILAVPPSSWYLVRKLVSRNQLAFAFAATVLVMTLGFGGHALWQAGELRDERDQANVLADRYRDLLLEVSSPDRARRSPPSLGGTFQAGPSGLKITIGPGGYPTAPGCKPIQGDRNPDFDAQEFWRKLPAGPPPSGLN
jgi:serine/threonine protein kinase